MLFSHPLKTVKHSQIFIRRHCLRSLSTKTSDPLRILFCGSDEFSDTSLRAVHQLQQNQPDLIRSIDVACRPPKRVGRGLKQLHEGMFYARVNTAAHDTSHQHLLQLQRES